MRWTSSTLAAAALLFCAADADTSCWNSTTATPITTTHLTTHTTEQCQTYVNTTSVEWCPTTTILTTIYKSPSSVQVTTTPVITVLPQPSTATTTKTKNAKTVVTAPQNNVTVTTTSTSTSTSYNVTYIVVTSTVSSTSTTTLSTSTSTLSAVYGWQPIGDTTNMTYHGLNETWSLKPLALAAATAHRLPSNGIRAALYSTAVVCTGSIVIGTGVTTIYAANTTRYKTLAPSTSTLTVLTTITTTSTLVPKVNHTLTSTASTTITSISNVTSSVTTYTTTTETATLSVGVVDFYGPCGPTRLLGPTLSKKFPDAGDEVDDLIYNTDTLNLATSFQDSAYDCCVQCITGTDCAFGAYDTAQRICYLADEVDGVCGTQEDEPGYYVAEAPSYVSDPLQVFNGFCGYLYDGGVGY